MLKNAGSLACLLCIHYFQFGTLIAAAPLFSTLLFSSLSPMKDKSAVFLYPCSSRLFARYLSFSLSCSLSFIIFQNFFTYTRRQFVVFSRCVCVYVFIYLWLQAIYYSNNYRLEYLLLSMHDTIRYSFVRLFGTLIHYFCTFWCHAIV